MVAGLDVLVDHADQDGLAGGELGAALAKVVGGGILVAELEGDVGQFGVGLATLTIVVVLEAVLEQALGTAPVLSLVGGETGVVDAVGVDLAQRGGTGGLDGLLEERGRLLHVAHRVGIVGFLRVLGGDGLHGGLDILGLLGLGIQLRSLLVGVEGLGEGIVDHRLGHFDQRDLTGLVEVDVLVGELLLEHRLTADHGLALGAGPLTTGEDLELLGGHADPDIACGGVIGVEQRLTVLEPSGGLGVLLRILGGGLSLLDRGLGGSDTLGVLRLRVHCGHCGSDGDDCKKLFHWVIR